MSNQIWTYAKVMVLSLSLFSITFAFQNCGSPYREVASEEDLHIAAIESLHIDEDHGLEVPTEKLKIEVESSPLLADRVLVLNKLAAVFGNSIHTAAIDTDAIRARKGIFGSPCSPYENYLYKGSNGSLTPGDSRRACTVVDDGNNLGATVFPSPTVDRQGLIHQICLKATTTEATLNFALRQIDPASTPAPTYENVLKAFRLFYRFAPEPHAGLIESLQIMMPEQNITAAHWVPVFYTICASSHWQVL